jgi:lipopolysaccharide exporter
MDLKKPENAMPAGSPEESLSGKAARGTIWLFSLRILDRLLKIIRLVVLARILSPEDFGVFGVALLVLAVTDSFSRTGYSQALIQKKQQIKDYLDTAWTVQVIRGVLITLIVFLLAQPASLLFKAPSSVNIIRVISLSIAIQGINNIAVVYFHRKLKFNKFFKYQFLGTLVDFCIAVSAAYLLRSVWALALGLIAGNATRALMSYIIHPYRPAFRFVGKYAKELFRFGKWILVSSVLIFMIIQGDDIFVGSLLGASMLGFYQMAYRISNAPTTETTHVISLIGFPVYSSLQDDIPRLKEAYLKVFQIVTFMAFPMAALILVLVPEFTLLFLGENWMPIVPAAQVLALAGLARSILAAAIPVLRALGYPVKEAIWQAVRLSIIMIMIFPLTKTLGIQGAAVSVLAGTFIACIGFSITVIRIIRCRAMRFIRLLVMPLAVSLISAMSIAVLKYYINGQSFSGFFILALIGFSIFMGLNYIFDRFMDYGIGILLKKGLYSFRKR